MLVGTRHVGAELPEAMKEKVLWRMSLSTYEDYIFIIEQIDLLHPDYDRDKIEAHIEDLHQLPGMPAFDAKCQYVVPELKTNEPLVVLNMSA